MAFFRDKKPEPVLFQLRELKNLGHFAGVLCATGHFEVRQNQNLQNSTLFEGMHFALE